MMSSAQVQQQNDQLNEVFQFKKEKFRVEIRKKNLQQDLQQRRMKIGNIDTSQINHNNKKQYFSGDDHVNNTNIQGKKYEEEIQEAYQDLTDFMFKSDFDGIYDVLFAIYLFVYDDPQMLSIKVPKIVQSGILEIFGELLTDQYDQMQNIINIVLEILCNITIGSAHQNLKIYDIVLKDKILKFLDFTLNPNIIDSALHIISHFCHDSSPAKNHMMQNGLLEKVIEVYQKKRFGLYTKHNKEFYTTYTWCLSAIASDENLELNQILELNNIANELFMIIEDQASAKNLLWYFYRVTHNSGEKLSLILACDEKGEVLQKMIDFLSLQKDQIKVSLLAFQPLSNYLQTTNETIIKYLLDRKILDGFNYLVETSPKYTKTIETIFWSISNIILVSNDIVKYVISHPIFENIIKAAQIYSDKRQEEAITCLCHLQQTSSYQQINTYYHLKVYEILIGALSENHEESILLKIIDALYCAVLRSREQNEAEQLKFLAKLELFGLSAKLDNLQNYPSEIVFEKAIDFIEAFYPSSNNKQSNN